MGNIAPVILGLGGLFGAISQQQAASQAAGLSREALELQKRLVDEYIKELEEIRPYRRAMRELAATRMTWAPHGWSRWTSDPWRLTSDLPPIQKLLTPPPTEKPKEKPKDDGGEPKDKEKPPKHEPEGPSPRSPWEPSESKPQTPKGPGPQPGPRYDGPQDVYPGPSKDDVVGPGPGKGDIGPSPGGKGEFPGGKDIFNGKNGKNGKNSKNGKNGWDIDWGNTSII